MSPKTYVHTAYIALVNDPPVHNFVSICGPLEGEATCPANIAFDLICPIWKLDPYGADLAFSGYWKNTKDKETYVRLCRIAQLGLPVPLTSFNGLQLKKSTMLADVLNEKAEKNSTTAQNFKNLNALMMIMATEGMHAIFTL